MERLKGHSQQGRGRGDYGGQPAAQFVNRQDMGMLDPKKIAFRAFKPRNERQVQIQQAFAENDLTFLVGPAGTGKTVLAAAFAIEKLITGEVKTIVAARPAIEAGDPIGFLSGGLVEKVTPFLRPILDNMGIFIGAEAVNALVRQNTIELTSLSYLRGRTLNDCVLILDEMQNATPSQMKLALTRAGDNCKVLVTMDPDQCDLPEDVKSAAEDLDRFQSRQHIGFVELENRDIVRSRLVKTVLAAYSS